jgi:hypothetical protein
MKRTRRTDGCMNCGETREMAAHGLCFKCYRQEERDDDERFAGVDRNNPGVRREHKKLFRGFTSVMTGLSDLSVQESAVLTIRRMLDPYVAPIAEFLSPKAEHDTREADVNSEHTSGNTFTVTTAPAELTSLE